MTDYELLTLAAKAIGEVYCVGKCASGLAKKGFVYMEWDPLIDDGDALRLAVKLKLLDLHKAGIAPVNCRADEDPYAATRRAIVRAAAMIGKDMK